MTNTWIPILLAAALAFQGQVRPDRDRGLTFAELQREAQALTGGQASMEPVELADAEQIGQEVDRRHQPMVDGFRSLPELLAGAESFPDSMEAIAKIREDSRRYTEVTEEYYRLRIAQQEAQADSDARDLEATERDIALVEADLERLEREATLLEDQRWEFNEEAERLAREPDPDVAALTRLAGKATLLDERFEANARWMNRLQDEGQTVALAARDDAHGRAEATAAAISALRGSLAEVRTSNLLRELFLNSEENREKGRWAERARRERESRDALRRGFWPRIRSGGDRSSPSRPGAQRRVEIERARAALAECMSAGESALECAGRLSEPEDQR